MERRYPASEVQIVVTTLGPDSLWQVLTFPDGSTIEGFVEIERLCEEGDELLHEMSRQSNPIYVGTQKDWYDTLNRYLLSRGQYFNFPD
jgi:hypothetical protein